MTLWIGALALGLAFACLALGVFLSFRLLSFPDLTVDGSLPLGAAVSAVLIVNGGWQPWLTLPLAIAAGALAGATAAKRIGMIWTPAEANSAVATELARQAARELNVELVEQTIASADEVLQAAQSLLTRNVDLFFVSTDSTVVSALESVVKVANDNKKPLFGNDPDSAARGAVAALGIDYFDQGYDSGVMAALILKGEKSAREIPITPSKKGFLAVNTQAARLQGVTLSDELLQQAAQKYDEIAPAKPKS
jgi:putative ABC transport system substrate-binding protein